MKIQSMEDLMVHELQDLRSAEEQLVEALPKMAEAASSAQLQKAFNAHLKQTKTQLTRVEKALESLGKGPGNMKCKGMEGLVKEGDEVIKNVTDAQTRDAALIGAAQRVEHYEIAGYGTARAHAEELGLTEIADLLQITLDEEGQTNTLLTQLAEGRMTSGVNERAAIR
ncbi:MAG: ferritin-like domain-containing protein [Candidatus Promineofilum sp.]|nr:ferritin-like domain-containing protein [Promineifilum sp.]